MTSLGVFFDLNLKKSNDLMEVFDEALSKTNNLMQTMDNFNTHKKNEKITNNIETNKNDPNNFNITRKNNGLRTYNEKKPNKAKLKPIKNNQYYFRKREPYNYQKEYENELVNQIEKLFNPSYQKNGKNEDTGLLSFLSPLINSNVDEKNKQFYKKKLNINKSKVNNELNKLNNDINNEKEKDNDIFSNGSINNIWNRGLNKKYSKKNEKKLKTIEKKSLSMKKNENSLDRNISQKSFGEKFKRNENYRRSKYDIPEINELKKNRYFSRTKSSFRNAIVARDVNGKSRKNVSNVDQLINKLKKHYS